jgi:hypothetical protein
LFLIWSCTKEPIKTLPVVFISNTGSITSISANITGEVSSDGGSSVASRGICWSTNSNASTASSNSLNGAGIGSFTSSLSGLSPGVTYHVKAFAINNVGTGYSDEQTFTTVALAPVLTTTNLSAITSSTAAGGGNITNDGGSTITARGVCYSLNQNPTTSDNKTADGSGIGIFVSSIAGLTPGTTYYVRAYATNSVGTSYGNQVSGATSATLATLTSTALSSIASTTATSGGIITADGGATITSKGVCWSINQTPTTADNKTSDGTGIGSFTSSIAGLNPGVIYYVRAYAVNSIGTSYGNQVTATTPSTLATLTTNSASAITSTTATSSGIITADGGAAITSRGVCWSTSQNPTILNNKTIDGSGTGSFTSSITGLTPGTTYYARAYAVNAAGTVYGNQIVFVSVQPTTGYAGPDAVICAGTSYVILGAAASNFASLRWLSGGTGTFTNTNILTPSYSPSAADIANGIVTLTLECVSIAGPSVSSSMTLRFTPKPGAAGIIDGLPTVCQGQSGASYGIPSILNATSYDWTYSGTGASIGGSSSINTINFARTATSGNLTVTGRNACGVGTVSPSKVITINALPVAAGVIIGYANVYQGQSSLTYNVPAIANSITYTWTYSGTGVTLTGTSNSIALNLSSNATSGNLAVKGTNACGDGIVSSNFPITVNPLSIPTISTTAVSNLTSTTLSSGGSITSDGGSAITARGICWSTNQNPTIADSKTSDGTGIGSFISSIDRLSALATYHLRAYATNSIGTSYGNDLIFTTLNFSVGEIGPAGGFIFYDKGILSDGWRFLEVNPIDVSSDFGMGCYCTSIPGTSDIIGAGIVNTAQWILAGCGNNDFLIKTKNYTLNGYKDWFIPSKDELNQIYLNLKVHGIGNFTLDQYWSSSPASYGSCGINGGAWVQSFNNGNQYSEARNGYQGAGKLRVVRRF